MFPFINIIKQYFFLIISLFLINITIINSSTTDFEMDRVCSDADFAKYKHKTGYRTAQHFADDEGMYKPSAHPFYRSLFMTREKKDMNLFINSIGFELALVALGGAIFINYIVFIVVWAMHKGLFRILSEEEKNEKQSSKCKYFKFFLMFISLLISLALSGFGIIFISNFKNNVNLSDCSYLRFTNHGLYGAEKNFAGAFNLRESFYNYTYSLKSIENFISRMNLYNNEINTIKRDFNQRMDDCNAYSVNNSVYTPNPDGSIFYYIKTNYQEIYGPKTNETSMIGIIYKHYNEKIVPVFETLDNIKEDYNNFLDNKDSYIAEIEKYAKYFDVMTQMYQIINENIGRVYDDYKNIGVNYIFYIIVILYFIYPLIIILLLIFIFVYVCKKQAGVCIVKFLRIIIHFLWNVLFIFTSFGFIFSGYIGSYRKYSYDLSASFNYLISPSIINDPNSEENTFSEFANNSEILRGVNLFSDCYSSSQSTNIANILEITDSLLFYFNKLYQDYNTLLQLIYHNNLDEEISPLIEEYKTQLNSFLYNISKTTSSQTHLENDVSRYFAILNKYTDYGNEETYQIDCVTKMYDFWTTNRDDCPEGYSYSLDGSQEKNCLVISDKEWTLDMIHLRYLPVCKMKDTGESTGDQIDKYLDRIKGFYESNDKLIINMKNGADILVELYNELVDNFYNELIYDNNTFLNFTLPFSKFTDVEDIYSVFDCGILKQDLIDFYDTVRNKLSSISIAHLVLLLLINIFNVVSIYLLITVLYTFYRTEIAGDKRKSKKEITNDKVLTINKSGKKKSTVKDTSKRKTKSKLYVSMGKRTESETPSSSTDHMRSSKNHTESENSQNEEEEESEEKTGKSSSNQTSSKESGSRSKSGSGSKSGSYSKSGSRSKSGSGSGSGSMSNSKSKSGGHNNEEEENEEEEIESGVRDDGSAMS